jgi:hypothetical protein
VWPHHFTKRVDVCGRIFTLRGEFVCPYHYTKSGDLCGRIIKLRGEVCVAVTLH